MELPGLWRLHQLSCQWCCTIVLTVMSRKDNRRYSDMSNFKAQTSPAYRTHLSQFLALDNVGLANPQPLARTNRRLLLIGETYEKAQITYW